MKNGFPKKKQKSLSAPFHKFFNNQHQFKENPMNIKKEK
jgi:hypothetical protein